jgi:hypothetical protein
MYGLGGWIETFFGAALGVNAFFVFVRRLFVPLEIFVSTEGLFAAGAAGFVAGGAAEVEEKGHSDPPSAMPAGEATTNTAKLTAASDRSILFIGKPLP